MKVTLSNGQSYSLGFRHHYYQDHTLIGDKYWGEIKSIKIPIMTECYLREFNEDPKKVVIVARGIARLKPGENPDKRVARQYAITHMTNLLCGRDKEIVLHAYDNRKTQTASK